MHYILFIVITTTHWFGPNTHTYFTQEFNNQQACIDVKDELNREFQVLKLSQHAECAAKGI